MRAPHDNDQRSLRPANPNLEEVRESEGPSPAQDGPYRGTGGEVDDMAYLDTSGEMYAYLGHFREDRFLEEGHNETVGSKVSKLVREGKPQKQAVAIALDMKRRGKY